MTEIGEILVFRAWHQPRVIRSRPRAFLQWREAPENRDSERHQAITESLSRVILLQSSASWRAATNGDAAAAIGLAIAVSRQKSVSAHTRNLVLTALWLRAGEGDQAAKMTLLLIQQHNGRLRF